MRVVITLIFLFLFNPLKAELVEATDNFFHLKITAYVKANPAEAYAQFINVGQWWSSDHTWFGDAANMTIEPKAGGCFCEKSEGKEVMHMMVSAVFPDQEIRMLGGLGPLQMMALDGAMSWKFLPSDDGGTQIVHEYRVTGGGQKDQAPAQVPFLLWSPPVSVHRPIRFQRLSIVVEISRENALSTIQQTHLILCCPDLRELPPAQLTQGIRSCLPISMVS